jgi:FHA domain
MLKLLIKSGPLATQTLELRYGTNRLGRGPANDFQIVDPSVSTSHCEILVEGSSILVRDLGSTNGTFIDRAPIREGRLRPGQTLHIGSVELELDTPRIVIPEIAKSSPGLPQPSLLPDGTPCCLNHAELRATLECSKCGQYFCEACVRELKRAGGATLKFCLECSGRCEPIGARKGSGAGEKSFAAHVGNAFQYPFRRDGLIVLIAGTVFFFVLSFAARFSFYLAAFAGGYLFAYLQKIILSSAHGDEALPGWPEFTNLWEDIGQPLCQWLAALAVSFGPAILCLYLLRSSPAEMKLLVLPLIFLGSFYFPMAVLGVAMHDSVTALNPVFVFHSIFKIPGPYLVACLVLGVVVGVDLAAESMIGFVTVPIIPGVLIGFVSLYFLIVEARILGLLYFAYRDRLQWF